MNTQGNSTGTGLRGPSTKFGHRICFKVFKKKNSGVPVFAQLLEKKDEQLCMHVPFPIEIRKQKDGFQAERKSP
jgi:hypothetical protein